MTVEAPVSESKKSGRHPLRRRTGTAAFHLSTDAVDFGLEDLEKLSQKEAVMFVAEVRWGSTTEMPCPHCGTIDTHYWSPAQMRWKCKCCGKRFSVTSDTVWSGHKIPLSKILKVNYSWSNGASGKAALQLRRDWNVSYATAYTLMQKAREGLLRGHNIGILCGVQEMDGMDLHGRRYKDKRNKPQGGRSTGGPKVPEHLLKPPEGYEVVGPPTPHKQSKKYSQPQDRRLLLVMRQRGVSQGKGASDTRVAIALSESSRTVQLMGKRFASAESVVMTDEDPAYAAFGRLFAEHKTINHSKGYSDGKGVNNNQAESFNRRMRRGDEEVYLNVSNKYLPDYAAEQAWREDTRRLSTGNRFKHLLRTVLGVGMSLWWRGYTHGHHRRQELLIEGAQPALGRGRQPGWKAMTPR